MGKKLYVSVSTKSAVKGTAKWFGIPKDQVLVLPPYVNDRALKAVNFDHNKNWILAVENARKSRQIVESWLTLKEYDFEILESDNLKRAYSKLDYGNLKITDSPTIAQTEYGYLGALSVEGVPVNSTTDLTQLLQQFLGIPMT